MTVDKVELRKTGPAVRPRPETLGGELALAAGLVKDGPCWAAASRRRESVVLDEAVSQSSNSTKGFRTGCTRVSG
ncbi:hypothetical protein AQ619_04770 [Caulobacter henricii]|uniref:Uncharacterized protein n=1 Tax=Caulobacter henricii TaxID=69395 RepID=A0A0P0NY81_9CAUL|nr:hypothetical protein AQ619_04770 [Caulobacter henricii]